MFYWVKGFANFANLIHVSQKKSWSNKQGV